MDFNPYGQITNPIYSPATQQPKTRIKQVNGRQGAEAYQMAPGSSDILMDTTAPLIYVVVTDDAGFKTVTPMKVERYEEPKPLDAQTVADKMTAFEAALTRIDQRLAKFEEELMK